MLGDYKAKHYSVILLGFASAYLAKQVFFSLFSFFSFLLGFASAYLAKQVFFFFFSFLFLFLFLYSSRLRVCLSRQTNCFYYEILDPKP